MTVSTTKAEQVYTGNGATTSFATNFKLLDASHIVVKIRVIATGVETTKVLDTDYSVSNIGADAGATVTYPLSGSVLPATEQIVLVREVPFTQSTSIKNQSGFFPGVVENAYDLIVMMAQQSKAQIDRSIRVPTGSTITPEIPLIGAGRTIAVNSGGTAFEQGPTVTEISTAQTSAATAKADADRAEAAQAAVSAFVFPPGAIVTWPDALPNPDGWLEADGSTLNVDDYPDLFVAIGRTFGGTAGTELLTNPDFATDLDDWLSPGTDWSGGAAVMGDGIATFFQGISPPGAAVVEVDLTSLQADEALNIVGAADEVLLIITEPGVHRIYREEWPTSLDGLTSLFGATYVTPTGSDPAVIERFSVTQGGTFTLPTLSTGVASTKYIVYAGA